MQAVNAHQTPALTAEIATRNGWTPDFGLSDSDILRICIELIAYSQQAQARRVQELINGGIFKKVFVNYDVHAVANLQHDQLYAQYWNQIGAIRFPSKLDAMIGCAQALLRIKNQHPSFMSFLLASNIPVTVKSQSDIEAFWREFAALQQYLCQVQMPFFNNLTSLCHLLMTLGYDCAKPDSAVMSAAVNLGIVSLGGNPKKLIYTDRKRKDVVMTMQVYCICRSLRVTVLDVYLLICGGQTGARHLVSPRFYQRP
ncbi:MAG: DNA-3-methyladenine glycosylase I [Deltaproteobacteria bacterium]|nr:DNA-3-methyladenine glycosylase I [Deltaproteobacteria bacterium]